MLARLLRFLVSGADESYDDSVHESLLPQQDELEDRPSDRHGHAQQPLIEVLLHGWTFYTQAISGVFGWILGSIGWTTLSETQIRQINALRASIRQKFDPDNPDHQVHSFASKFDTTRIHGCNWWGGATTHLY